MKKIALLPALVLCSLLAAPALAAETAQVSATKTVRIDGFAYKPAALRIGKGTTVTFRNEDNAPHTATRARAFNTKRIRAGRSASVRFNARGTFRYHCTIHPFMKGKVVVK